MRHASLLIYLCLTAAPVTAGQIKFPAEITDDAALPRVMPRFAKAVIAFQQAGEPVESASLFRAQLVAGLYRQAPGGVWCRLSQNIPRFRQAALPVTVPIALTEGVR